LTKIILGKIQTKNEKNEKKKFQKIKKKKWQKNEKIKKWKSAKKKYCGLLLYSTVILVWGNSDSSHHLEYCITKLNYQST